MAPIVKGKMNTSDWIALGSFISAAVSAWYTHKQWIKVKDKVGMIDRAGKAIEILPAWYTGRMMSDYWLFGLYTCDGSVILVHRILAISDDGKWMDVELSDPETGEKYRDTFTKVICAVASDRTTSSVQISNIVAAVDLQSS